MRILFVCTGNICRSPLAERLAATWAEEALGAGAAGLHLRSAGTDALDGKPMEKRSAAALAKLGGDPAGFLARKISPAMADDADLVLTMTRRQRRLVLSQSPRALRHTFTLPEAADLLRTAELDGITDLPLRRRAADLAVRMNAGRARRRGVEADDVFDPIGQAASVHGDVAARIARKLRPLADVLFCDGRPEAARTPKWDMQGRPGVPLPALPRPHSTEPRAQRALC
jgi:protein-tyrosine phosphatase